MQELVPAPAEGQARRGGRRGNRPAERLQDQGSIYIGTDGVLYSPYIAAPVLLPAEKFKGYEVPKPGAEDHYMQFVEACRGNGQTSTPFAYSGPLTEMVLLGCLATRFPQVTLEWDAAKVQVTNVTEANAFVRRRYRAATACHGHRDRAPRFHAARDRLAGARESTSPRQRRATP